MSKTITKKETINILRLHGFETWTNTACFKGVLINKTSFFDYFGIKPLYIKKDVLE